ncbi:uncharacterized UDP-glucosyltransferase YojK-like [Oppia nitens]|uniref:uncharacterized UDP-glucosyltransferase YojK-like n=1 Tax=Oppia nitens TaxID=1686743 RepID=UPI0023DAF69D|nr:uncharacterized UDP-glucosyltransferase YojK-like [Oppia nitens]
MAQKLKVLFIPLDGIGHINSAIGMAQVLIKAGHECWFGVEIQWTNMLANYGIQTCLWPSLPIYKDNTSKSLSENSKEKSVFLMKVLGIVGNRLTPAEKCMASIKRMNQLTIMFGQLFDDNVYRAIHEVQPDIIVTDQIKPLPSVIKSGIPWVMVCASNPLTMLSDHRTPPPHLGLPTNGPKDNWPKLISEIINGINENNSQLNYYKQMTIELLFYGELYPKSQFLNIYDFPLELDYHDIRPLPDNWYRFDNFMRKDISNESFIMPEQLRDKPGKVIYFSFGSICSVDVNNMKRLIAILLKSQNVFIVSKGPLGDEYDLTDNMWGQTSVPQTQVLPLVDLVISHGGNNTITECFYFGKPMIVMPLFGDQFDNAQRVHEKGFGIRLDAYKCSEKELLTTIETLLNDKELNEKMQKISQRIKAENNLTKLPQLFENVVNKYKHK